VNLEKHAFRKISQEKTFAKTANIAYKTSQCLYKTRNKRKVGTRLESHLARPRFINCEYRG